MRLTIFLGLAGWLINSWPIPVLGEGKMYFGGIAYLLVAIAAGPLPGALAATIASGRLFFVGELSLLPISLLEAAVVGWLTARRRVPPVLAALLFWSGLGIPLTVLLGLGGPGSWISATFGWAMVLTLPLNGLFNVLLAELPLLIGPPALRKRLLGGEEMPWRGSLRAYLLHGIALIAALPLIGLSLIHGRALTTRQQAEMDQQLSDVSRALAREVDAKLGRHRDALVVLAEDLRSGIGDLEQIAARLEASHRVYRDFLTLRWIDAEGRVTAASPRSRIEGLVELPDLRDQQIFRWPTSKARPYFSDISIEEGWSQSLVVHLAVPVLSEDGLPIGVVVGTLGLRSLEGLGARFEILSRGSWALLDRYRRVAWTSEGEPASGDFPAAAVVEGRSGGAIRSGEGYLTALAQTEVADWEIRVEVPKAELYRGLDRYFLWMSFSILAAVICSILMARWVAGRVTQPLEELVTRFHDLQPGAEIPLGDAFPNAPLEVRHLVGEFEAMATRLAGSNTDLEKALAEREALNRELQEVLTNLDLQVRRRTEELREAKARAEDANRAKSELIATASHEIRTPMNGILGMAELLLEGDLEERQQKYGEAIHSSAEALLRVIDDLLDLSKIEAGKLNLQDVGFDVREVLDKVLALLTPLAESRGLVLVVEVAPGVPQRLRGDRDRLRQILINLASNAVKFTETGTVMLEARVETEHAGSTELFFSVVDTGVGISAEVRDQLFQPFSQSGPSAGREEEGGTGLGLAISKRLVETMGGEIGVESRGGGGSRFWFRLPFKVGTNLEVEAPEEIRAPKPAVAEGGEPEHSARIGKPPSDFRILLAEDNRINQTVALSQLEALGYLAKAVDNGALALEALEREAFDLVLMDCQMPELDGYGAVRRLRQREKPGARIPVIAVTAHAMKGERERCLAAGMDGFLAKPLRMQDLAAALERWLPIEPRPRASAGAVARKPDRGSTEAGPGDEATVNDAGIDYETIRQIRELGRDLGRDLIDQVLGVLVRAMPGRLEELRLLEAREDFERLALEAHSLKGSSGNAGVVGLSKMFSELQDKAGTAVGAALLGQIEREFRRIEPLLSELIRDS